MHLHEQPANDKSLACHINNAGKPENEYHRKYEKVHSYEACGTGEYRRVIASLSAGMHSGISP
jgi:hypothetical protein